MIIKSVHVKGFRSLLDVPVPCSKLTALVGPNGAGKSALLRAIQLFYAGSPQVSPEDFYDEDTSRDIEVEITFTNLGKEAGDLFAAYIENGDLTVVRVLSLSNGHISAKYHGSRLQNPEFAEVRAQGTATKLRKAYNDLRQQERYSELPSVGSQADAVSAMDEWEATHLDACKRIRDDGQFFGFAQVAQGYLGRFTRFIHVPAVRDAAQDAEEGRGSAITEIMDLVVRSALADREELKKLREDVQARYDEIMDPSKVEELSSLEQRLSNTLRIVRSGCSGCTELAEGRPNRDPSAPCAREIGRGRLSLKRHSDRTWSSACLHTDHVAASCYDPGCRTRPRAEC